MVTYDQRDWLNWESRAGTTSAASPRLLLRFITTVTPYFKIGIEWAGLRRAATVLSIKANNA
jgi:hypothetical protein